MHIKTLNTINVKATISKFLALLTIIVISGLGKSYAQTYDVYLANDTLTAPNVMEVDVYIKNNGGTGDWGLRTFQCGYQFDATFTNGGAISGQYKASSSDLTVSFPVLQWNATNRVIFHNVNAAGSCPGPPASAGGSGPTTARPSR